MSRFKLISMRRSVTMATLMTVALLAFGLLAQESQPGVPSTRQAVKGAPVAPGLSALEQISIEVPAGFVPHPSFDVDRGKEIGAKSPAPLPLAPTAPQGWQTLAK